MPTVSFHLKEAGATAPTAIYIWFNPQNGAARIKLYTGDKILPAHWTAGEVQLAKETPDIDAHARQLNGAINRRNKLLKEKLLLCWAEHRAADKIPEVAALRQLVNPKEKTLGAAVGKVALYPVSEFPYPLGSELLLYSEVDGQLTVGQTSAGGVLSITKAGFRPSHWAYAKVSLELS